MIEQMLTRLKEASLVLPLLEEDQINNVLVAVSRAIVDQTDSLLSANAIDLSRMDKDNPVYDRLKLTKERLDGIAMDMLGVARLPSPVGVEIDSRIRPNGMCIRRVRVPFGVIGVIYEARPNVGFDVFSLCFKSRNVCALKGGSDADNSNRAVIALIHSVLEKMDINPYVVVLLPPGREAAVELMRAVDYVDLLIPRGSSGLIRSVREQALVPVIETGAGVCHTFFDIDGDRSKCSDIVFNAKTRRVSVCNALDTLLVHEARLADLPLVCEHLATRDVVIEADEKSFAALVGAYPDQLLLQAGPESFGKEFLGYRMSIRSVSSFQEALSHIRKYSSRHSECIVTENTLTADAFQKQVDAACLYVNVSTAFTDGAQFGLGAEIGISTQKLHARGPMGLEELTTYKWLINGDGNIRE